ncbi:hypothetical protein HD806DRAFT_535525 [Xylariaceae sp. AK1471]|nr:hypothetical protein HD806DRAFT_535525 [Xylariaceae sp. AK1471]
MHGAGSPDISSIYGFHAICSQRRHAPVHSVDDRDAYVQTARKYICHFEKDHYYLHIEFHHANVKVYLRDRPMAAGQVMSGGNFLSLFRHAHPRNYPPDGVYGISLALGEKGQEQKPDDSETDKLELPSTNAPATMNPLLTGLVVPGNNKADIAI